MVSLENKAFHVKWLQGFKDFLTGIGNVQLAQGISVLQTVCFYL